MTFKLNCKIVEINRLKNPELLSIKVFESYNVELMCHAHSSRYDALFQNKGKWVDLIIRPSSISFIHLKRGGVTPTGSI
jgi:hypothetical protein